MARSGEPSPRLGSSTVVALSGGNLAKNTLVGYVTLATSSLLGFLSTPILLNHLGQSQFGVWAYLLGITTYTTLVEAGIGSALVTRSAGLKGNDPYLANLFRAGSRLLLRLAFLAAALTTVAALLTPWLLDLRGAEAREAVLALIVVAVGQVFTLAAGAPVAVLLGAGRSSAVLLAGFAVGTASTLMQLTAVFLGGGITALAWILSLSGPASYLVFRRQQRKYLPVVAATADGSAHATELWRLGNRNLVVGSATLIGQGSDVLIVGTLLSASSAGAYAVAAKGYGLLLQLASRVLTATGPFHAAAWNAGDTDRQRRVYLVSIESAMVLALPIGGVTAIYSRPLLTAWVTSVPAVAVTILTVLAVCLIIQVPGLAAHQVLANIGQSGRLARVLAVAAVINVSVSVAATLFLGTAGPAVGTACTLLVFEGLVVPRMACRALRIPAAEAALALARPLISLGLPLLILGPILRLTIEPLWALVAAAAVTTVSCWTSWLCWGRSPDAAAAMRPYASRLRHRAFASRTRRY